LFGQATQASVNQAQPVVFQWTPKGFARSYHLQVSTDAGFSSLVVDQTGLTNMTFTLASVSAGTTYYWRVNVSNTGGTSDWATASFATVSPMVLVTIPNGGQVWQRGLKYFIQWNDNLAESVVIDLYKGGAFLKSLATNSSAGAYQWEAGLTNVPGSDYTIKVSSSTNAALFDVSDSPFSIVDAPVINAGSVTRLADGSVQFSLTAPGVATATVLGSTNLTVWEVLQTVPVTGDNAVFKDNTATNYPARFYRVRLP